MKFLIHYLVRTAVTPLNFNFLWDGPVRATDINDLRGICADDAMRKGTRPREKHQQIFADDIVIANIIPMPDGEPKQIGGA